MQITNLIKKLLNIHDHDFRRPIIHNGRYWMKCTNDRCNMVRDSYLYDGTNKIEKR